MKTILGDYAYSSRHMLNRKQTEINTLYFFEIAVSSENNDISESEITVLENNMSVATHNYFS